MRIFWLIIAMTTLALSFSCGDDDDDNGGTDGDSDGDSDTDGDADTDGDTDSTTETESDTGTGFENTGVCRVYGLATAEQGSVEGVQEYYLKGDEGLGDVLCRVRFDLGTAGELPATECTDCVWTAAVELTNPTIVEDVDGTCAASELGFDQEKLDEMNGLRFAWGWVFEYAGHSSVLMQYDENSDEWKPLGTADWNEEKKELWYDRTEGACGY